MTVVDVNTGKFTGSGGNLEETVTKNNLEAAEEIVRQLRLRDIGGIIVVDFIDMVLESNRDLVLRRLVECLGRDRTRHQVAEVTSLGLVQMTRKRIGTGLLEAFSENCEHCQGRGVVIKDQPVEPGKSDEATAAAAATAAAVAAAASGDDGNAERPGSRTAPAPPRPRTWRPMARQDERCRAAETPQPRRLTRLRRSRDPARPRRPNGAEARGDVTRSSAPGRGGSSRRPDRRGRSRAPARAPARAGAGTRRGESRRW